MWESYFRINCITRSLATPARFSRGRIQERVQGDTAYHRRFPLHPLCKLRRGQPPSNPRLLSDACRFRCRDVEDLRCSQASLTSRRHALQLRKSPRAPLPSQAAAAVGHRATAPSMILGDAPTTFPAASVPRSHTSRRLCAYRRSLCLAKPSIPPSRLAPRGAFHFVHLCTFPTCRKGCGKPSASRKLKPSGFPLSPLRPFGAGASSTA